MAKERNRYWVYSLDNKRIGFPSVPAAKNYILNNRPDADHVMIGINKGLKHYGYYLRYGSRLVKVGE